MMVSAIIGNIFLTFLTIVNYFRKSFLFEWVRKCSERNAESTKCCLLAKCCLMANEPKDLATKTHTMITRKILKMPVSAVCLAGLLPIYMHRTALPLSCSVMLSLVSNTVFLRTFSLIIYLPVFCGWPIPGCERGIFSMFATWVPQKMVLSHPISFEAVSL